MNNSVICSQCLTRCHGCNIIKLPFEFQMADREQIRVAFYLPDYQGRQVMDMSGYEITMICIVAMTFLLKLIEVLLNQIKK